MLMSIFDQVRFLAVGWMMQLFIMIVSDRVFLCVFLSYHFLTTAQQQKPQQAINKIELKKCIILLYSIVRREMYEREKFDSAFEGGRLSFTA